MAEVTIQTPRKASATVTPQDTAVTIRSKEVQYAPMYPVQLLIMNERLYVVAPAGLLRGDETVEFARYVSTRSRYVTRQGDTKEYVHRKKYGWKTPIYSTMKEAERPLITLSLEDATEQFKHYKQSGVQLFRVYASALNPSFDPLEDYDDYADLAFILYDNSQDVFGIETTAMTAWQASRAHFLHRRLGIRLVSAAGDCLTDWLSFTIQLYKHTRIPYLSRWGGGKLYEYEKSK